MAMIPTRRCYGKSHFGYDSLTDGFIQDRSGSVGALYRDLDALATTEPMREAILNTGAAVERIFDFVR